jgi:hypothetical protein
MRQSANLVHEENTGEKDLKDLPEEVFGEPQLGGHFHDIVDDLCDEADAQGGVVGSSQTAFEPRVDAKRDVSDYF